MEVIVEEPVLDIDSCNSKNIFAVIDYILLIYMLTTKKLSKDEQETVSRDKKDRHEFEQLSALATRMGLYSRQYAKAVVVSKVPLPNYRFDLDDKRPHREVVIHFGLERRVDVLLREHFSRKPWNIGSMPKVTFSRSSSYGSIATDDGLFEQQELQTSTSAVMEKIINGETCICAVSNRLGRFHVH